jgi:hypothetical protein
MSRSYRSHYETRVPSPHNSLTTVEVRHLVPHRLTCAKDDLDMLKEL